MIDTCVLAHQCVARGGSWRADQRRTLLPNLERFEDAPTTANALELKKVFMAWGVGCRRGGGEGRREREEGEERRARFPCCAPALLDQVQ